MKKIKKYISTIKDEMESAKSYAEKYINYKIEEENNIAEKYKQFANQELEHGNFAHTLAEEYIQKLSKVMPASPEMKEKWNESHQSYISEYNEIKAMLK